MNGEQELIQRLERLETANRRMKLAGIGMVLIVGAALVMGQAASQPAHSQPVTPTMIEAHEFVLRDKDGKVRGLWNVNPAGGTALMLADRNGKQRGAWTVQPDGYTALQLRDGDEKRRAVWGVMPDGDTSIILYDSEGKGRGMWEVTPEDSTALILYDRNMKTRAVLGSMSWTVSATGATEKTAESSLVLFDTHGNVLRQLP